MSDRTAIGVSVDAGWVQVVEAATEGDRLHVRRAASEALPLGPAGAMIDPAAVARAVRTLLRRHGMARSGVYVALGGPRTMARVVEVDPASAGEVEQILQDRIARYAVYENVEIAWKAEPIGPARGGSRAYLAASAVAADVSRLLHEFQRVGVGVESVEPYELATARAQALSAAEAAEDGPVILVAVRGESTDFLIARGRRPMLIRSVEVGARVVAEKPDAVESIVVEARRSLAYARSQCPDVPPRVRLAADVPQARSVVDMLRERLPRESPAPVVDVADPWCGAAPPADASTEPPSAWAALGAALAGLGLTDAVALANLAPPEWPQVQRIRREILVFVATTAAALLLTVAATTMLRMTVGEVAAQAEAASAEMQRNTTEVAAAAEVKHTAAVAARRAQLWNTVRMQVAPFDWVRGIQSVLLAAPANVRVTVLEANQAALKISGEARSADDVHEFVRRLALARQLEEAKIARLDRVPVGGRWYVHYTIVCQFHVAAPPPADPKKGDKP